MAQVSPPVALDPQTYSAQAQRTQITWTAQLKCDQTMIFLRNIVMF